VGRVEWGGAAAPHSLGASGGGRMGQRVVVLSQVSKIETWGTLYRGEFGVVSSGLCYPALRKVREGWAPLGRDGFA